MSTTQPKQELGMITTQWVIMTDSVEFVKRYGQAIKRYLRALLKNKYDAEEVAQDFFLVVAKRGFPNANREKGRFRDYLKVAVRNAALNFIRKRQNMEKLAHGLLEREERHEQQPIPDQEWVVEWRECLLNRAWQSLEKTQHMTPPNSYYTALRLAAAHPDDDSETMAARASTILGHELSAETFRKQLSRARRLFAQYLVEEVAQTLNDPSPDVIEEELVDLGLLSYVRKLLPDDWQVKLQRNLPRRIG